LDSITQAALGAVIGEAFIGHKVGKKGALWGAVLATLPDLDVIFNPLLETTEQIVFHRGPSHSIFLLTLVAPLVGWTLHRRYSRGEQRSRREHQAHGEQQASLTAWIAMALLALLSQPFLDVLTSYGTHLFWPVDRTAYAFSAVSIIDPIYTFALLIPLGIALFSATGTRQRRLASSIGLALSSGYLVLTIGVKMHVRQVFVDSLERQSVSYERFEEMPAILNSVLWVGMADTGEAVEVGLYSLLDDDQVIEFQHIDKNRELLAPYVDDVRVKRLVRFSRGLYTVSPTDDGLLFEDLHIGRQDFWLDDDAPSIFRWELVVESNSPATVTEVRRLPERGDFGSGLVSRYFRRVLGE
jgi:inner membrane protein